MRKREGICYGRSATTGRKLIYPQQVHAGKMMQLRGETGGGKSVLLAYLVLQYLQAYSYLGRLQFWPVIIIDLGGDLFLFNLVREICLKLGRVMKWLSLDPDDQSFYFDPLQSCLGLRGSSGRKANFVTAGLNLAYAEGFGTGYFGRLNFSTIRQAFVRLETAGIASPSLQQLGEELSRMARLNRHGKEAAEALYALDQLLDYAVLMPGSDPATNIDVDAALENCEVLYFFLPSLQEPLAARAVATLAAWTVINAAAYRQKRGLPRRNIPLLLDEAAQIIHGQSFQDALVLCRKYGIRLHVVHQSEAQLESARGTNMSQVIKDNCAIKAFFSTDTSPKGKELADLQGYSKDELVPRLGTSRSGLRTTTSEQEHERPKLQRNTVLDVSSTFGEYFLIFRDGKSHSEPQRVIAEFPTSLEEYLRLSATPLPRKELAGESTDGAEEVAMCTAAASREEGFAQRAAQLQKLLVALQQEEVWKLPAS